MTDKKGKLLVFSAPSGSGKTTIVRTILSKYKELDFSVSATTRKRRENETDGKDYFFISEEEFKKKIDKKLNTLTDALYRKGRALGYQETQLREKDDIKIEEKTRLISEVKNKFESNFSELLFTNGQF